MPIDSIKHTFADRSIKTDFYSIFVKEIIVKTLSYKTLTAKPSEIVRKWHVVDAEGMIVGRMATQIATILRGKHKPSYTPNIDTGDYVIVINADKVRFTGNKMQDKIYQRYSGYTGGQKKRTAQEMMAKKPTDIVEKAVRGMLPKSKLGRAQLKKLFLYTGTEHPHAAQNPEPLTLN